MELSIIIAAYNAEKYLKPCLESVAACTMEQMECILVNDGSTDATRQIGEAFAREDERFRVVNKPNTGVSDSRNTGISLAGGKYVLFLDADDYINTGAWPSIERHAREGRYDFIAYSYTSLFESGKTQEERFPDYESAGGSPGEHVRHALLATPLLNTCWGKLMRREVIEQNALRFRRELKTCEDAIFVVDFVQRAETFLLLNQPILFYRIHGGSAMRRINLEHKLRDFSELFECRKAFLEGSADKTLTAWMCRQSFSILTDLFRSYASSETIRASGKAYRECMQKPVVSAVMRGVERETLSPVYKKLEYDWLRLGFYTPLAVYFKIKALFLPT